MTRLKYIPDAQWERLPMSDFRARFFVESFVEKLRIHTPHFYQSRLMNIFSACEELVVYAHEYSLNDRNAAYVISALEEIEDCWSRDVIAQEIFADMAPLRSGPLKLARNGDLGTNSLNKVTVFSRAVLGRKQEYKVLLNSRLEEAVLGSTDLTQRERITDEINRLTSAYTTLLLNDGYSPTYLYNRSQMFSRENNYSGRNFEEQFKLVVERLNGDRVLSFDVFFGIHATRTQSILAITDEQDVEIYAVAPEQLAESDRNKLDRDLPSNLFAKLRVEATDYVSAAFRARERLDRLFDAATALELMFGLDVSATCITSQQGAGHKQTVNVDALLAFMSSDVGTSIAQGEVSIRAAFGALDESAKDQLRRSLRYLRLARTSVSLEQKLLNSWIALESLFSKSDGGILGSILDHVPQFYAVASLSRRVRYLKELLIANEVPTTPRIRASVFAGDAFDEGLTDGQVFSLLRDELACKELFHSLGAKEHLKFKLMWVFQELKDNQAIMRRIQVAEKDVIRQLRRIYFLRNKIAHTGHFEGVRPQLVTHLLEYVAVSYRSISSAITKVKPGQFYSISELFAATRMGADLVTARANSAESILGLDNLIPMPIV